MEQGCFLKKASACNLLLLLGIAASHAQDANYETVQSFRFSLIQIPVWVANKKGVPIPNLRKKDFRLHVDNHPVPINGCLQAWDRPMELVYLLDISGSMGIGGKLAASIETISHLIENAQEGDRWQIIVFADGQVVRVLDQSQAHLWSKLKVKLEAYGKTALYDALSLCHSYFSDDSLTNRGVLLFTDGNDNQSRLTRDQLFSLLATLDIPVFIVGIADGFIPTDPDQQEKLGLNILKEIANITGGELVLAEHSSQLPVIARRLSRTLRPQYLLSITVERGGGDRYHNIRVGLKKNRGFQVRYRKGYIGFLPELMGGRK